MGRDKSELKKSLLILARLLLPIILISPAAFLCFALFSTEQFTENKTEVIPHGMNVRDIAAKLYGDGAVVDPLVFRLAARVIADDSLHAGEYVFTPQQNMVDMVTAMRDGDVVIRRFTVAEGLTVYEIADLLRNDPVLAGDITALPPEGSLLPETYNYSYGDSRAGLLERMKRGRQETLDALWADRARNLPLASAQEAVVMASLIEKETGKKTDERARVAGVFYNRLRKGMRLQSDPTVIYALTKGQKPLGRELTHNDMATASPYNTYVNAGLPPNPICNPGKASMEAALHPEANDYLYFVADGTGGHAFAATLAEHNRNIAKWLNLSRQ